MSTVAEFCADLLKRRKTSDNAAVDVVASEADASAHDDDAVFLLSTLCQLYLDVSSGKCCVYISFCVSY